MKSTIFLALAAIFLWGIWGFFGKIATTRIGIQASFWNALSLFIIIFGYLLISNQLFPIKNSISGITFGLLAGVASGLASVMFYILLGKNPAGFVSAIVALYPVVTILLSFFFLNEPITFIKIVGFVFAILAIILLNL
jgi:bacterial/archaeal transporter family protein